MFPRNSIRIHNEIRELQNEARDIPQNARDRAERLYRIDGRVEQLQTELAAALEHEDALRAAPGTPVSRGSSLTEQIFGHRASFKTPRPGFRAAVTVPASPTVFDPRVPGVADVPRGFVDTLTQSPTTASPEYFRRGAMSQAAAQWNGASAKPESSYAWTIKTAPLAWIAHHTPITKTQASDYSQLDAAVRGALMIGLAQAKSREALTGANEDGIVGVLNTLGIQTYDPAEDGQAKDTVHDSIRRMATRVQIVSGFTPTHVAVSPQVAEAHDLLKGEDEHYLVEASDGRYWNLEVVVDNGLAILDDHGKVHHGAVVYAPIGATWYTQETDNIEVGLVDDQFINNAYTLLAESRNALGVQYPDAFCFCADAIPAVDATGGGS